jgi:hypothetical protein
MQRNLYKQMSIYNEITMLSHLISVNHLFLCIYDYHVYFKQFLTDLEFFSGYILTYSSVNMTKTAEQSEN